MFCVLLLLFGGAVLGGLACETVLTHAEIAADRARFVEFFGPSAGAQLGYAVSAAGDIDDDGFDDFALVALSGGSFNAGSVYLVFGRSAEAWASAHFNLSATETPASWIKISGLSSEMFLGAYGVAHGDFNGDGVDDLLLSTKDAGKAFCVFGHAGVWSFFSVSEVGSANVPGFTLVGANTSSIAVGNAGDINGDGIDDILASEWTLNTSYIVFGKASSIRSDFVLVDVNGVNGFSLVDGTALGYGSQMGSVGDVNGDGFADFGIGTSKFNDNFGRAYILFARNVSATGQFWASRIYLDSDINGANGFAVQGSSFDSLGWSVVGAGDINADGFDDVFIGTNPDAGFGGAFLVLGHSGAWQTPISASLLNGTNGFRFVSTGTERWGCSGGWAGDIDGDGFDDVLIGGYSADNSTGSPTGAVAILFGHGRTWPAELGRNDAVGSVGFLIDGPFSGSRFGLSAHGVGDVNGDGLADFVVGAQNFDSNAGYAVLVFGTADDHCAVCSNITDECLVCDDGFISNGANCKANQTLCASSSSSFAPQDSSSSSAASQSSAETSGTAGEVVVVIETGGGGGTVGEVAAEVAQLLGVDVGQISVVEITPGTFEVTVINEEIAQQLVTLITQCIEEQAEADQ